MVIEYELTKEDVLALSIYHSEHQPHAQRTRLIRRIAGSLFIVGIILTTMTIARKSATEWTPMSLLSFLIVCIAFTLIIFQPAIIKRWLIRIAVAKADREGRFKLSLGKQELTLTPEALIWKTPISESKTSWSAVEKIVETEQHVFIYTSAVAALVVPQRAFPDESAYREFVETARRFHGV